MILFVISLMLDGNLLKISLMLRKDIRISLIMLRKDEKWSNRFKARVEFSFTYLMNCFLI